MLLPPANRHASNALLLENSEDPWAEVEEFFLNYIRITAQIIRLCTEIMRDLADEPDLRIPEELCLRHLNTLQSVLQFDSVPYYMSLRKLDETKIHNMVSRLRVQSVASSIDLPGVLAKLIDLILSIAPQCQKLGNLFKAIILICNNLIQRPTDRNSDLTAKPSDEPALRTIYYTIRSIDKMYQESITKKSAWVSSDLSDGMLRCTFKAYTLLCQQSPQFVELLARDLSIELPDDLDIEQSTQLIAWGWKLAVLKRLLTEGRMELRVQGVETLQSDLIVNWQRKVASDPSGISSPFIQYLVRFIKNNKLVDYLVGVDSHLQLIGRSGNIVGFLIVTSAYTDAETDVIWKTVTESQDRRVVSEVLSMLSRTSLMHASTSPALLYACKKVLALPLARFDGRMIEFCEGLLGRLCDKPTDLVGAEQVDAVPLRICMRLMRDSTAAEDLPVEQKAQLQDFGSKQLEKFLMVGISDSDRMEMYERCISDIAEKNQFVAGSIQVLIALVPPYDSQEMRKLATEFDLTGLVINELLHFVNGPQVDFAETFSKYGLVSRLTILFRLINTAPDTITADLSSAIWNEILLSDRIGVEGRKAVWNIMVNALTNSSQRNTFLERCVHEYLPVLGPNHFSRESFAFAKNAIGYELRFNPPRTSEENEVVSIPGMDQIWKFILTAPPGTIETEAAKFAIDTYLDHPIINKSPRSAVDITHVAIVDRCVDQLKSAAAALKLQGDTTNNDVMEIESLDDRLQAHELRFRRSLVFLRQLLNGLRTRPRYRSPRSSPPQLPQRPLKGAPVTISWQSFQDERRSNVNTMEIGEQSTALEFVERLKELTGFSKFTAIWSGQRVELLENPEALVREIKHSTLLILRKATDAQEVVRDSRRQSTSVDSEISKHFDDIYDLLALEDHLAREVGSKPERDFDELLIWPIDI